VRRTLGLWLAVLTVTASCGGSGSGTVCASVERILEPSSIHVLPGAEVTFTYSPPTSGPHRFPAPSPGVYDSPIDEPTQVAALEEGAVILQYGSGVDAAAIAVLEQLRVEDGVIVAPGVRPFDDSAAVAFTAWGHRQLCTTVDVSTAQTFIDDRVGALATDHE
jgi:hypothetical protein